MNIDDQHCFNVDLTLMCVLGHKSLSFIEFFIIVSMKCFGKNLSKLVARLNWLYDSEKDEVLIFYLTFIT